jgi:hypothetical protein
MIKLRLDVDYPYPSRFQSFVFAALNRRSGKNYLKNSKILAKMINESPEEVRAFWFFTPQTTPDAELLSLLRTDRHEVALHVANDPFRELEVLEKITHRKVKYYTVHGTARLVARLMWRRKIWEAKAPIPAGFPLKSFYDFPTMHFDIICYLNSVERAVKMAEDSIAKGLVLHVHPEWLFDRGTFNHRGPYYEPLRRLLKVDKDFELLAVRKKGFEKIAQYPEHYEYLQDFAPLEGFLEKLADREVDLFTFIERKWCCPVANTSPQWLKAEDNIALLQVVPFSEWWEKVGKKTRNMVRKAEKSGINVEVVEPTEKLAEGIWKIYNETPFRQGRAFSHYGWTLENVVGIIRYTSEASTYIGAFLEGELVGFIQLVHGDKIAVVSQILSLQKFWDKAVNNALIAKAVEVSAAKQVPWLMYGRMGNHPSLDNFKQSNGFAKFSLTRYYVPITRKGKLAAKLGLHRPAKDVLPDRLKLPLIPVFNWVSRTKMRVRLRLRSRKT